MSWGRLPDNPFVGLRPFESHESLLFFGRQEQIVELLEQLHATRFLAVIGSSGSGKSSLVRAGLIPKLEAGFLVEARDTWRFATLKPGDSPMANLAAALERALPATEDTPAGAGSADDIRERGVFAILERAKQALAADANLLILVDQFEELFRFGLHTTGGERGEEAAHFVSFLLELAAQRRVPIYVVLTMRSDFLGECDSFLGLPEAMNQSQYLVPRLTRLQRREAIEGPVKLYRAAIAPRLTDRLLNETADARDDLPVLQHALMRTWTAWSQDGDGPIDVDHYAACGTIEGALSQHAEEAMKGLSRGDRRLTRRLFQALTETDAGNRRIRRPAHLSEVEATTGADRAAILAIVDRFRSDGRSFLVVSSDGDDDDPLIDISHESLIRQWSRLKTWVDQEAESARIYRRLAETAALHEAGDAELYRGAALQVANRWSGEQEPTAAWAGRYDPTLRRALAFLDASRQAEEQERRDREARRKQALRRARLVAAVLGSAFLLSLVLGLYSFQAKQRADAARADADNSRAATEAALKQAQVAEADAEASARLAEVAQREAEKEAAAADRERHEAQTQRQIAERQTALALQREEEAERARLDEEAQRQMAESRLASINEVLDSIPDPELRKRLRARHLPGTVKTLTGGQEEVRDKQIASRRTTDKAQARSPAQYGLKLWANGATLRVRFLDGDPDQHESAKRAARIWSAYANLHFDFNDAKDAKDAELRISFDPGAGSWAYVGTDALAIPEHSATMNLGIPGDYSRVHEFGHVLGLIHENQNPNANLPWDKETVYDAQEFWSIEQTDRNILRPYTGIEYRAFDVDSIMLYEFPAEWFTDGKARGGKQELSASDKEFVRKLYPP